MGIQGLLPFLKEIQRDVHVSSFRGRRVAVDGYCWLHRGAYSCAMQLVMKTEKLETLPFIKYCMKRVNMLLKYDITPVMVFDGGYLPLKDRTERERRERRQVNREKGKALLREGKKSAAFDCFQKSVDVSPEMAHALIKECRSVGVECIVAPYEADSQLAYLSKEQIVDLIITEDSDLLVFGCRKVMFKMDDSGNGKLIETDQLGKANRGLVGFTVDSFRHMCILSGCDYLASVPGIGLGKALKLMKRFNKDPYRVVKALHYENGKVPKDYESDFRKADQTFLYQLVFDPRTQQQVRLNPLPSDIETVDFEFAGAESSPRKAVGMARGNINPLNHAVMDTYSPSKGAPPDSKKSRSSWSGSVMGGASGWGQLPAVRPPSSLISSESITKHFIPPKKLKPRPEETEEVDSVEDLHTTYLTATMGPSNHHTTTTTATTAPATDHTTPRKTTTESTTEREDSERGGQPSGDSSSKKPTTKSRFFSSVASCESSVLSSAADQTPSDLDVARKLRVKRRLSLLPHNSNAPPSPDREGERSDDEIMAERCELRRKRLSSFNDGEYGVRTKLQRFAYTKSAARENSADSSPISQLNRCSSPSEKNYVSYSPTRNPFAKKSRTSPRFRKNQHLIVDGSRESFVEGSAGGVVLAGGEEVPSTAAVQCDTGEGEVSDQSGVSGSSRSFMTSEDFITTRNTLLGHVISLSRPNGELNSQPTAANKKRAALGSNSRRRTSATKCKSRFKAPKRSSDVGQTQLSQFSYTNHPKMSREQ